MFCAVAQMIQLAFQPAFDAYHGIFRYFELLPLVKGKFEIDKYRIFDFYMCFPEEMADFRFSPSDARLRREARLASVDRFEAKPNSILLLSRMRPVQLVALETLEREGYLAAGSLEGGMLIPTDKLPSTKLGEKIDTRRSQHAAALNVLGAISENYSLLGLNGIKARSGLMEYRYDAV
jgi:hypothetical protein